MRDRLLDADAWLRAAQRRDVRVAIGVGFVVYLLYHLTRFRFAQMWPIGLVGDAGIMFEFSKETFARVAYPDILFPYSPSGVILLRTLGIAGPTAFMICWYALIVSCFVIAMRAAVAQERADVRAAWPLIGAIAVVVSGAPVGWDLRNANSNLVYLGLVMAGYGLARPYPAFAGAMVGLSVSLKLYSGFLIGWLLVNGPRRMFTLAAVAMLVLWVALPLALFGVDGTVALYRGWLANVARIADLDFHTQLATTPGDSTPIVTLHRAIVNLTGEGFHSSTTQGWLWVLRAGWIAALAWYAWQCRNTLFAALPSRAALSDWTVLLIAPLPISPWLEPYHAIPLLVGGVLLTAVALDTQTRVRDRSTAAIAIAALALFLVVRVPFAVRGLQLLAQFTILTIALGLMRPTMARSPAP